MHCIKSDDFGSAADSLNTEVNKEKGHKKNTRRSISAHVYWHHIGHELLQITFARSGSIHRLWFVSAVECTPTLSMCSRLADVTYGNKGLTRSVRVCCRLNTLLSLRKLALCAACENDGEDVDEDDDPVTQVDAELAFIKYQHMLPDGKVSRFCFTSDLCPNSRLLFCHHVDKSVVARPRTIIQATVCLVT